MELIREFTKKSREERIKIDFNKDYKGIKELFVDNKFKFSKEDGVLKLHKLSENKENWEIFWENEETETDLTQEQNLTLKKST